MTKHRRTKRRSQKGGFWPFTSSDPSSDPNAQKGWFDWFGTKATDTGNDLNTLVGNAATKVSESMSNVSTQASELLNKDVSLSGQPTTTDIPSTNYQYPATGGRRRRAKSMKGGKGGLGLTYYATPVSGLKVVEPTRMAGGSRKRRRSHRTRRHKKR